MYHPCGVGTHDIKIKIRAMKEKPCQYVGFFYGLWQDEILVSLFKMLSMKMIDKVVNAKGDML